MTTTVKDPVEQDARSFADALGEFIRVVQFRDRDRACCYDLSVSQCYALKAVVDARGLTVNDLAAELYLDKSTASRVANGLVSKGMLGRTRDQDDGRIVRLVVTPEGQAVYERITDDLALEYAQLLEEFAPEVRAGVTTLVQGLTRTFASRVEATNGSCCVVK